MYTQPILITLGVLALVIIPILYFNSLQKKKARKEIYKLNQLAKKNDLNLDFAEAMPNLLIGMDATSRKLMTVEGFKADLQRIFDLGDLVSCEVLIDRTKSSGGINLIALKLELNIKGNQQIVFYNEELEVHPNAERRLEMAEKWKKIICANINHR